MIRTKIRLSPAELELAANAGIILTKNSVLQKTKELFEDIQQEMQEYMQALPPESQQVMHSTPKISRGENYRGLPYLVLDYPRIFQEGNMFAIRTMFWWGHFFSSTLLLSGIYKQRFESRIIQNPELLTKGFFLGVSTDPWQHHFEADNYARLDPRSFRELYNRISAMTHIKIAAKWPLDNWQLAANEVFNCWKTYLEVLGLIA
jgi:hypothetical protein